MPGKGFDLLRAAGIDVITGVLAGECADLNLIFNHWIATGQPLFAAKSGVTLDGKVATRTGDSRWITGEAARADGHRWRRLFPAIAVGAGTVRADNPRLTARVGDTEWCPWRFVFDGLLRTVTDKSMPAVYTDEFRERTIVVTTPHGGLGYVRKLNSLGVKTWVLPSSTPKANFEDFRQRCADEGITGVFFEGGAQLLSELLQTRELDYMFTYHAPVLFADEKGKSDPAAECARKRWRTLIRCSSGCSHEVHGDDALMRWLRALSGKDVRGRGHLQPEGLQIWAEVTSEGNDMRHPAHRRIHLATGNAHKGRRNSSAWRKPSGAAGAEFVAAANRRCPRSSRTRARSSATPARKLRRSRRFRLPARDALGAGRRQQACVSMRWTARPGWSRPILPDRKRAGTPRPPTSHKLVGSDAGRSRTDQRRGFRFSLCACWCCSGPRTAMTERLFRKDPLRRVTLRDETSRRLAASATIRCFIPDGFRLQDLRRAG